MPQAKPGFDYDAFISYSRRDSALARRLEAALEKYRPPSGLGLPNRPLRVFRDEADFTGTEYDSSLERNLAASSKLLLLCSPASRGSVYVDGEIEIFARLRGGEKIVTVLVDGIPNNEAVEGAPAGASIRVPGGVPGGDPGGEPAGASAGDPGGDPRLAFPDRLVELLPVPLAADYREFDPARDKVDRGRFQASWFKLLADLYQEYGVSRARLEQREERRRRRRRAITSAVTGAVMAALAALAGWAVIERGKAIRNRNLAVARQLVAEAELAMTEAQTRPELSILLAIEGLRREHSADGDRVLRSATSVVPPVVWAGRHEAAARGVEFLPGGGEGGGSGRVLSVGEDGTARVWDVESGEETARFEGVGELSSMAVSPDGGRFATGGADGAVRLFALGDGAELWSAALGEPVLALGFAADGGSLVAASRAEGSRHLNLPLTVHRLDAATGSPRPLQSPASSLQSAVSPDRSPASALGSGAGLLRSPPSTLQNQASELQRPRSSPQNPASALDNWGSAPQGSATSLQIEDGVGLDGRGRLLMTFDGLWELGAAEPVIRFEDAGHGYGELVRSALLSDDGELLALGTRDVDPYAERGAGSLRLYDQGGERERFRIAYGGGINALALSPDAAHLLTAGEDGTARVIETAGGREIWRLSHDGQVRGVAWHPSGSLFATAGDDGEVRLYRMSEPDPPWTPGVDLESPFVALSVDGGRLAALHLGRDAYQLSVWNVGRERIASVALEPQDDFMEPRPLVFAAGGEVVLLASLSGALERREAASGRVLERRVEEGRPVVLLAASSDGTSIATGSWDESVWMTGAAEWQVELSHRPSALEFSDDSSRLLAGSEDGEVRVLDAASGEALFTYDLPARVSALASDGRRIAIGGADGSVRLLELESGADLALIPLESAPEAVAFVDGGTRLRSTRRGPGGEIVVETHPLAFEALARLGCARLTRNLTPEEWQELVGADEYQATCETR